MNFEFHHQKNPDLLDHNNLCLQKYCLRLSGKTPEIPESQNIKAYFNGAKNGKY